MYMGGGSNLAPGYSTAMTAYMSAIKQSDVVPYANFSDGQTTSDYGVRAASAAQSMGYQRSHDRGRFGYRDLEDPGLGYGPERKRERDVTSPINPMFDVQQAITRAMRRDSIAARQSMEY